MEELDPTDRRTNPRIIAPYRLPVRSVAGGPAGFLVDLSRGGLRVRFLANTQLVDVERLCVGLPPWLEMGDSLELPGHFVFSRMPDGFRGPEGGFAFDPLPEGERLRIDLLIEGLLRAAEEDGLLAHAMSEFVPSIGSSLF